MLLSVYPSFIERGQIRVLKERAAVINRNPIRFLYIPITECWLPWQINTDSNYSENSNFLHFKIEKSDFILCRLALIRKKGFDKLGLYISTIEKLYIIRFFASDGPTKIWTDMCQIKININLFFDKHNNIRIALNTPNYATLSS